MSEKGKSKTKAANNPKQIPQTLVSPLIITLQTCKEQTNVAEIIHKLRGNGRLVFFHGAGTSAEVGIPTFRGDSGLFNNKGNPDEKEGRSKVNVKEYFTWCHAATPPIPYPFYARLTQQVADVSCLSAYHSLLRLLKISGRPFIVYTQNVDDIERRSGLSLATCSIPVEYKQQFKVPNGRLTRSGMALGIDVKKEINEIQGETMSEKEKLDVVKGQYLLPVVGDLHTRDKLACAGILRKRVLRGELGVARKKMKRRGEYVYLHGTLSSQICNRLGHQEELERNVWADVDEGDWISCAKCLDPKQSRVPSRPGAVLPAMVFYGHPFANPHQDLIEESWTFDETNKPEFVVVVGSSLSTDVVGLVDRLKRMKSTMTRSIFILVNPTPPKNKSVLQIFHFIFQMTASDWAGFVFGLSLDKDHPMREPQSPLFPQRSDLISFRKDSGQYCCPGCVDTDRRRDAKDAKNRLSSGDFASYRLPYFSNKDVYKFKAHMARHHNVIVDIKEKPSKPKSPDLHPNSAPESREDLPMYVADKLTSAGQWLCPVCNITLERPSAVTRHFNNIHKDARVQVLTKLEVINNPLFMKYHLKQANLFS